MNFSPLVCMLAQSSISGGPIALYKPIFVILALFAWLFMAQWAQKDIQYVKTNTYQWNIIIFLGGLTGFLAWLFLPFKGHLFWFGLLVCALLSVGAALTYVLHRNSLVARSARLLTPQHPEPQQCRP